MRYFLVNLAIHCVLLGVLILMACLTARRNKRHKTKSVFFYFLPLIFAILAILDLALITGPRMMDISSIASRSYYYDTGKVTNVSFLNNYFVVDGKCYFMNPLRLKVKAGDTVRIKHTHYSLFTSEVIDISNPDATATLDEKDGGNKK